MTSPTSEEKELYDSLSERQRRFVDEYLVDFNGAAAVERAGYNTVHAKKMAYNMLHTPKIKEYLRYKANIKIEKSPIKPDYVIKKIVKAVEEADRDGKANIVLKGCELLARHLGMFVERQEVSGPNGDPIKYEQVREAADAFTSAINSLIDRDGEGPTPFEISPGDES
jgi:phage terminase small subunit